MRTIAKAIATGAIITAIAIAATGCKDLEGAGIDVDTTATNHERLERIHGPIVNKPSGPPRILTPEEKHTRFHKEKTAEKLGIEDSYVDLSAIHKRNGYHEW